MADFLHFKKKERIIMDSYLQKKLRNLLAFRLDSKTHYYWFRNPTINYHLSQVKLNCCSILVTKLLNFTQFLKP